MAGMAQLASATRAVQTDGRRAPSRPVLTAAFAALAAAFGGLALTCGVALAAGLSSDSSLDRRMVLRVGADAWLLGHGGGLRVGDTVIGALPLGLTLVAGGLLYHAGRSTARAADLTTVFRVGVGAVTMSLCYAGIAALTAVLATTDQAAVSPLRACVGAAMVSLVFGGAGVARDSGIVSSVAVALPEEVRAATRGGCAVVAVMFGAGAALVTAGLVADFGRAATAAESLQAGAVGGWIATGLGVLLLPNAALLGASYLIGPGFTFGAGTIVAPSGVTLGAVPGLPLLAALPNEGPVPWWLMALVVTPVLAGGIGAAVAIRQFPVFALDHAAVRGGLAGAVGGAAAGLSTALAGGAIGPGRMADVGALVGQCVGTASLGAGIGGAATAVVVVWWTRRARLGS
jgi:Family of unknown function (DUF6350)